MRTSSVFPSVWIDLCMQPQRHLVVFISLFLAWLHVYISVYKLVKVYPSKWSASEVASVFLLAEKVNKYKLIWKCCHRRFVEHLNSVCVCLSVRVWWVWEGQVNPKFTLRGRGTAVTSGLGFSLPLVFFATLVIATSPVLSFFSPFPSQLFFLI